MSWAKRTGSPERAGTSVTDLNEFEPQLEDIFSLYRDLFIYSLLQIVFIGQREPIHLRRSHRRLRAGDTPTNFFLSSGE